MLEAPGKSKRKENPPRTLSGSTAVLPSLIPRAEPFCTGFELQHSPRALVAASADDDDDFVCGCGGGDVGCSFRKPPSPHGTHTHTVYGAASTLTTRRQQTVTILHHLWLARSAVLPQNRTTLGDSDGNVSMTTKTATAAIALAKRSCFCCTFRHLLYLPPFTHLFFHFI